MVRQSRPGSSRSPDRPYFFWLPQGFEPGSNLSEGLRPYHDDVRYLVSTIARKAAHGDTDHDGFTRLNSDVLRQVMTSRWVARIVNELRQAGVIETSPHRDGHHSRGYRLSAVWQERKHCRMRATDLHLLQRIWAEQAQMDAEEIGKWKPIHHALHRTQQGLTFSKEADAILADVKGPALLCQDILVSRIRHRDFQFSVSSTGRCFNAITGLKKTLRPALRMHGERLGSIDLSCAQPALLALLIMAATPSIGWSKRTTYIVTGLEPVVRSCPSVEQASRVDIGCDEFDRYRALVVEGSLYDKLLTLLPGVLRDPLKRRLLCDVFAKRWHYPSDVEECFRSEFPGVYAFIRAVNAKSHAALIRLLQQLEAWLVIDLVAPKLVEESAHCDAPRCDLRALVLPGRCRTWISHCF